MGGGRPGTSKGEDFSLSEGVGAFDSDRGQPGEGSSQALQNYSEEGKGSHRAKRVRGSILLLLSPKKGILQKILGERTEGEDLG